jgi:di/tricarboxylate transporter
MLVLEVVRIYIIAIGCMLALGWTGILDTQEMFSGFSGNAFIEPGPPVLMAAVCMANSFNLPTHQVNAFLIQSGGYCNADYIKAGIGMTILFLTVTVSLFCYSII